MSTAPTGMNPRLEVFCAVDPEEGREFVAVLTWFRLLRDAEPFPLSHANFYGSSAREAKDGAEEWLARQQAKAAAAAEQRAMARQRSRRREIA